MFAPIVAPRKWCAGPGIIVATLLVAVLSLSVWAARPGTDPPGTECLVCHGEKDMSTARSGKTVSLFVDAKKFAVSIHGEALLKRGLPVAANRATLRPEKFPMDTTVFTGRVPLEEFGRAKPREYRALVQNRKLQENLAVPYPPIAIRAGRSLGWAALAMGFAMVIWITYAMVFAYR